MEEDSYSSRGAADIADQERVIEALYTKLDTREFADVRSALMRSPSAMVPFMRTMLPMLVKHPKRYPEAMFVGTWWLKQFLRGAGRGHGRVFLTGRSVQPLARRSPFLRAIEKRELDERLSCLLRRTGEGTLALGRQPVSSHFAARDRHIVTHDLSLGVCLACGVVQLVEPIPFPRPRAAL